jgi:hypothetical protein
MNRSPVERPSQRLIWLSSLGSCVGKEAKALTAKLTAILSDLGVYGWSPQEIIGYLTGKNSTRGGDR